MGRTKLFYLQQQTSGFTTTTHPETAQTMSCNKDYAYNHISARSSTRIHHPPGGGSSAGSLIFGGGPPPSSNQQQQHNKENNNKSFNQDFGNSFGQGNVNAVANPKQDVYVKKQHPNQPPLSDAEKVREFTYEAGQPCPDKPELMTANEVKFISKMVIDELLELFSTVLHPNQAKAAMIDMIKNAKHVDKMVVSPNRQHELIAEQGDAFVDIWYYSLNAMAKKGVNLSKIFELVHDANMAKRDPQTGKFLKRNDGKIIKPQGWRAPNVAHEIRRQTDQGSWK